MSKKIYTAEEIIQHIRTAELEQAKGQSVEEAARKIGVAKSTLARWKAEYGGLRVDQASAHSRDNGLMTTLRIILR